MLEEVTLGATHPQPRVTALLSVAENLAPVSWHMPISKDPFIYAIAMREENYSHILLHQHKEFALNFIDYSYFELVDELGSVHGNVTEKFAMSGLHRKKASKISTTLIQKASRE